MVIKSLIKVLFLVLIPCAAFAQVLPDTLKSELQDGTEIDVVNGYDVNGNTCAIGISWGVSLAAGFALSITSVTELHIAIDDY